MQALRLDHWQENEQGNLGDRIPDLPTLFLSLSSIWLCSNRSKGPSTSGGRSPATRWTLRAAQAWRPATSSSSWVRARPSCHLPLQSLRSSNTAVCTSAQVLLAADQPHCALQLQSASTAGVFAGHDERQGEGVGFCSPLTRVVATPCYRAPEVMPSQGRFAKPPPRPSRP